MLKRRAWSCLQFSSSCSFCATFLRDCLNFLRLRALQKQKKIKARFLRFVHASLAVACARFQLRLACVLHAICVRSFCATYIFLGWTALRKCACVQRRLPYFMLWLLQTKSLIKAAKQAKQLKAIQCCHKIKLIHIHTHTYSVIKYVHGYALRKAATHNIYTQIHEYTSSIIYYIHM